MNWLMILWIGLIIQRTLELNLSHRNAIWMKEQGGFQVGKTQYPIIILVHILFFLGIFVEVYRYHSSPPSWWIIPLILFFLAQFLRYWCILSLGPYWNTRIWVIPGSIPTIKGPYRYIRHPNYLAVMLEFIFFPLIFGAYITSILISFIHFIILYFIRIPTEEKALKQYTSYNDQMKGKNRLCPSITHNQK